MTSRVREAGDAVQERLLLGLDLHDRVLQDLSYVQLRLAQLRSAVSEQERAAFDGVLSELAAVTQRVRDIAVSLSSPESRASLASSLGMLVDRLAGRLDVPVALRSKGDPWDVPPIARVHILRIVEEALNNVWKHAGASRAEVSLTFSPGALRVTVRDDGKGFVPNAGQREHLGIRSMERRAAACGGELHIESAPGQGTRVQLLLSPPRQVR